MRHNTPWMKSSGLPSDRLPPQLANPSQKQKRKSNTTANEPPKSLGVIALENKIKDLNESSLVDPDPKGGCFCQAKQHELSKLEPICMACGLVLCSVNAPQHPCPHCFNPLLTPSARDTLMTRLVQDLVMLQRREAEAREKAIEQARIASGSFPSLSGLPSSTTVSSSSRPSASPTPLGPPSHKVLSLGKNKQVTVSSYTVKQVVHQEPTTVAAAREEPVRIPPPAIQPFHGSQKAGVQRPFENFIGGGGWYVHPVPPLSDQPGPEKTRKRRRGGRKGKEDEHTTVEATPEG